MILGKLASKIRAQKKMTLFVLFFLPLLIKLGFWQLSRAENKQQLEAIYQEQQQLARKPLSTLAQDIQRYYGELTVWGEFDAKRYWLLDNQPRNGQVGYEVIMPFFTPRGVVMVNRGWLPAAFDRTELPLIQTPAGSVELLGYLVPPSKNSIINTSASDLAEPWPKRVLQLDIPSVATALNIAPGGLRPGIFRLNSNSPAAFDTQWPLANSSAAKHQAYAVQWFGMAAVLIILYGFALHQAVTPNNRERE